MSETNENILQKFKPQDDHEKYVDMWNKLIVIIAGRENFLTHHLDQLHVLCGLYAELADLDKAIVVEGMTYESVGRNGTQVKVRPEVMQRNRVRSEIRNFSSSLGLTLSKARGPESDGRKAEENDWE